LPKISFHSELSSFSLKEKIKVRKWLEYVVSSHKGKIEFVQYIFCDDEYLLALNQEHLDHDTLTDIITFRYQEHPNPIESDIYISVERVKENALGFGVSFEEELHRVMVHGILHLLGFKDKGELAEKEMRKHEDEALKIFASI
jgi:probable rRNA maturation factor